MTGSTTNYNLPFPEGIDKVAVHSDIQKLAGAVDGKLLEMFQKLLDKTATTLLASDNLDELGNGFFSAWSGTISSALGLPRGALGVLLSIRYGSADAGTQLWIPRLFNGVELWIRNELSGGWGDWGLIGGEAGGGSGGGTPASGFKTIPLALTRGNGGGATAETSAAVRFPMQYNAPINRWRLHIVDGNPRFNLRKNTGINIASIYVMPYNGVGHPTSRTLLTTAPQKVSGQDTDDLVTEWFDEPIGDNVPRYLSIGYLATAAPIELVGGCYVNTDRNANGALSMSGFNRRTGAPFDMWIEAETPSGTPVVANLGDSNSVGVGTDLPIHESYTSVYCRRIGALPVHYGHSGDSLQHWEDAEEEKWTRFSRLSPADAVLQMLGSNDMAGTPGLDEMKRRYQAVTDIAARLVSPIVHVGLLKPRTSGSAAYQSLRLQYNDFLASEPDPAREVHDLSSPVANADDTAMLPQYDSDGTHMNTAGHRRLADSITKPITTSPISELVETFEWTGAPNDSQSVMKVSGREKARNLYLDPALTNPSTWSTADLVEAADWDSSWTGNANPSGFALSGDDGSIHAGAASSHRVPVSPGDVVTMGVNLATPAGFKIRARIYWYDGSGNFITSEDAPNTPSSGEKVFTRVVVTGTAPAGAATACPYFWLYEGDVNPTVSAIGYLDGLTLEWGVTDGSYFDGYTPDVNRLDRLEEQLAQLRTLL